MSLLFTDYESAGSGLAKNAPKKKPFFRFWEMYFERFWKMIKLSLLTTLFSLPIITVGPAIAGMTKVLRKYTLDKDTFMFHDFIEGFSKDLLKTIPTGILDIIMTLSLYSALQVYPAFAEAAKEAGGSGTLYYILCVISVGFALTVLMMNFFIYPMIVATELSYINIIKNSFKLVVISLKTNIITLLIILLTAAIVVVSAVISPFTLVMVPVFLVSFLGFVIMFNSYPQIQKYVIDPYYAEKGEDNPEYDYLKPLDADDVVFTDKGGEEKPIEKKKKAKKGKVIS